MMRVWTGFPFEYIKGKIAIASTFEIRRIADQSSFHPRSQGRKEETDRSLIPSLPLCNFPDLLLTILILPSDAGELDPLGLLRRKLIFPEDFGILLFGHAGGGRVISGFCSVSDGSRETSDAVHAETRGAPIRVWLLTSTFCFMQMTAGSS